MCGIHLDRQDPFAEVDLWVNYRMQETPQNLVNRAFGRHDITLHIDDGCMGRGGSIPHIDPNTTSAFDRNTVLTDVGMNGDVIVGDTSRTDTLYGLYFTDDRKGIFHYSVIAHYGERGQDGTNPGPQFFSDCFFICDQQIKDTLEAIPDNRGYDEAFAYVFMHELGHGLLLRHLPDNNLMIDGDSNTKPDYIDTCMYQNLVPEPIIDYRDHVNPKGYPNEWETMSLSAILELAQMT